MMWLVRTHVNIKTTPNEDAIDRESTNNAHINSHLFYAIAYLKV